MEAKKVIFGFVGFLSSGKGTITKYLNEKHGAATFRFSTMLRDTLDRYYLPQTRENLVKISEILRGTFGEDIMAKTMAKDAEKSDNQLIIIDGIRRIADIEHLKDMPNFVLVEVSADPEVRYQRLIKRRENSDDAAKTYEQFLKDHELSTELSIKEVIKFATEHIDNNGSEENAFSQVDELVKKYQ